MERGEKCLNTNIWLVCSVLLSVDSVLLVFLDFLHYSVCSLSYTDVSFLLPQQNLFQCLYFSCPRLWMSCPVSMIQLVQVHFILWSIYCFFFPSHSRDWNALLLSVITWIAKHVPSVCKKGKSCGEQENRKSYLWPAFLGVACFFRCCIVNLHYV